MPNIAICCHTCYPHSMANQQTSMNISLPETMRQWVQERISADGYGTASEYFRTLVREDQRRRAKEDLDRRLIEALDSGDAVELTDRDWEHIRSTVRQRVADRAKRK